MSGRDRPSRHGAALGTALASLAERYRTDETGEPCRGCAFRRGSYANMSAATVKEALSCISTERETSVFGCHHGLVDGEPTRVCAGYHAALSASIVEVAEAIQPVLTVLQHCEGTPDTIREDADEWLGEVDPNDVLSDYQRAPLWDRRAALLKAGVQS